MNTNLLAMFLVCSSINSFDDTRDDFRKNYGFSYYEQCKVYTKIFKCLSACKSMDYKIFRMNNKCKCTCHEMKTTTVLPFFIRRTNGTTRKPPSTFRPTLYEIVGTLSPATNITEKDENTTTTVTSDSDNSTSTYDTDNVTTSVSTDDNTDAVTTSVSSDDNTDDVTISVSADDNTDAVSDTTISDITVGETDITTTAVEEA